MSKDPLSKNRFTIVWGATIPAQDRGVLLSGFPYVKAAVHRARRLDCPESYHPRESQFRVSTEPACGTIDELTDNFRTKMTRVVTNAFAVDLIREGSDRYQEFLLERGVECPIDTYDSRIGDFFAANPASREWRARREAAHDHPTLSLNDHDMVSDLLFSFGHHTGTARAARELAAQLIAYAEHQEALHAKHQERNQ